MAIKEYYKTLGIEEKAPIEEVRRAYRRLAKAHHPDVNKTEDAQQKFEEIYEAYTVLSDPEKRAAYDDVLKNGAPKKYNFKYQDAFDMFFSKPRSPRQPINGEDVHATVTFTVYEALHQAEKRVPVKRSRLCPDCRGARFLEGTAACPDCGGTGKFMDKVTTPWGQILRSTDCKTCKGYGKAQAADCTTCNKMGIIPEDATVTIRVPVGVHDGAKLHVENEGVPGREGGIHGMLVVTFVHSKQDRCRLERQFDVVVRETIDLVTALRGGERDFIMPDGERTKIMVSPGTAHGDRLSFPGKGLPHATGVGFCYIEFQIDLPRQLTDDQASRISAILAESQGG